MLDTPGACDRTCANVSEIRAAETRGARPGGRATRAHLARATEDRHGQVIRAGPGAGARANGPTVIIASRAKARSVAKARPR
jgi:hypothetical protein